MLEEQYNYLFKYIIIGSPSVGKSKIVVRFVKKDYVEEPALTIGVEFGETNIQVEKKILRIQIWDTAGQELYKSITRNYYKNCVCAIIVYDITNRDSFNDVKNWIDECKNYSPKTVLMALIGNKCDLKESRVVSTEEGQDLANENEILFYETSAKEGINIKEIFQKTGEKIYQNIKEGLYNLDDLECGIKKNSFDNDSSSVILSHEPFTTS